MWRVAIRVDGGDGLICKGNLRDESDYYARETDTKGTRCVPMSLRSL